MASWGVHSFENDDATAWAAAYCEMGLDVAKSTIDVARGDLENGALSADLSCRAIAACEAIAFALGRGSPAAVQAFSGAPAADRGIAQDLTDDSDALLEAITSASELKVIWSNANQYDAWAASLMELRSRLVVREPASVAPEPQRRPVAAEAGTPVAAGSDDIHAAIAALSADVRLLRQEMAENILRLAELIEARK
ncbi:DUF4259 domain-containing protein [Rhodobacteraceae bacterium]|nr:DUF4259 domain-containing protein [Paracoccaceae bacterium]